MNEGIKCSKNCVILSVNKPEALVHKSTSEAAITPPRVCNKPLLNQNVPQCVYILNKTVRPFVGKRVGNFKREYITVNDKTLSEGGNNLIDFEAFKRDLLYGENSSKISNIPPVVCAKHLLFKIILI